MTPSETMPGHWVRIAGDRIWDATHAHCRWQDTIFWQKDKFHPGDQWVASLRRWAEERAAAGLPYR